jgi:excisionase family DNA binding protein
MTITVPEAARRLGRNPETIRRWIREGKLRATKVGTQHVVDELDLAEFLGAATIVTALPPEWQRTFWGGSMPDVVAAVRRSRREH